MNVELVLLLDLEADISEQDVQQGGGHVIDTRRQCGHQARVKGNQVHPKHLRCVCVWGGGGGGGGTLS